VSASLHGAGQNGRAGEVTEQLISSSTMYLISPLSRQILPQGSYEPTNAADQGTIKE